VRNFVESDREFQAWLKRHAGGGAHANGGPAHPAAR